MRLLLAASAALALCAPAVQAQTPAPAAPQSAQQGGPADVGLLPGAELSADCGGLNNLAGRAWCVTAPLGQIGALADAYEQKALPGNQMIAIRRIIEQRRTGIVPG